MNNKTPEQEIVLELIRASKEILRGANTRDLRIAAKIDEIQRNYPCASEVHTTVIDGVPTIVKADNKISDIVGYSPEELQGKSVRFIMSKDFDEELLSKMIVELHDNGMCVKLNENLCKDGSIVKTFGWIFRVGINDYREFVMRATNVIGYDVGTSKASR